MGGQDIYLVLLGSYTVDTNTVNNPIFCIVKNSGATKFELSPYIAWNGLWLEYDNGTDKTGSWNVQDFGGEQVTNRITNKYPELFYTFEFEMAEQIGEITEEMVRGVTV